MPDQMFAVAIARHPLHRRRTVADCRLASFLGERNLESGQVERSIARDDRERLSQLKDVLVRLVPEAQQKPHMRRRDVRDMPAEDPDAGIEMWSDADGVVGTVVERE